MRKNHHDQYKQQHISEMWTSETKTKERMKLISESWGDALEEKESSVIRITGTNIHGLSTLSELSQYIIGTQQISGDINCFQELNVDMSQVEVVQKLRGFVRGVENSLGDCIQVSSSSTQVESGYRKRGGTMVHVRKKWAGMNMTKQSDQHGRWSRVTINGEKT